MTMHLLGSMAARLATVLGGVTLGDFWSRLDSVWGERVLVTEGERSRTASELASDVARWADSLSGRVDAGRPVVIALPNSYDQFLACFAVSLAGGLAVPVNDQMTTTEIDHVIADAGAEVVLRSVADLESRPARRPRRLNTAPEATAPEPSSDDVAALFYTSGTTGLPKGVALTHRSLVGQLSLGALVPPVLGGEVLVALPVAHIMGFAVLAGMAAAGMPVLFRPRFDAHQVLDVIEDRRPFGFVGVPAMYRKLDAAGAAERDLSSIRVWMSGADAMAGDLARTFKSYGASATLPWIGPVGEAAFVEGYGMVEVGGGIAMKVSPPMLPLGVGDSVGFRLPGYRFRVVDQQGRTAMPGRVGELWVKGPGVLKGYWKDPVATAAVLDDDGWLRTGDLVRTGPAGTVLFCGRVKAVVKSGGYSVYPLEVETVIAEHPSVLEAAVVGAHDDELGEIPVAALIARPGCVLDTEELLSWCRDRLSHYKVPRRFIVVDELPRTGTSKVNKAEVVELFERRAPASRGR